MLYIIRHGKTDWNAKLKLQGSTDIPINKEGRSMAIKAREKVDEISFDLCYSSPLMRARETAELLLANQETPIIVDNRLIEMSFGAFEGIENSYSNPEYEINVLFNTPEKYVASQGAESIESLLDRTREFLDDVIYPKLKDDKNILIVGHGAMNCALISNLYGYSKADFWKGMTGNCELIKIDLASDHS